MNKLITRFLAGILIATLSSVAFAKTSILGLQQRWAQINYTFEGDKQEDAFKILIKQASDYVNAAPKDAERLIWSGIIKSTFAGVKGGLGALSFAKEARNDLEKSLLLDETALSGSAHTSLATLYSKVPGWPIGFGSNKKAAKHFKKALQLNPAGIDANFFYGEFLYEEKSDYEKAEKYLLKAQNAAPRENRPLADKERQKEISNLLAKVNKKLARKRKKSKH